MPDLGLNTVSPADSVLFTERLLLRVLAESDLDAFYALAKDAGPLERIGESAVSSLDEAKQRLGVYIAHDYRAIVRGEDGVILGYVGVQDERLPGYDRLFAMRLDLLLKEEYWNQGYATEALKGLLVYVFDYVHPDMVWARVGDFNHAAIKVLSSAGFLYADAVKDNVNKNIPDANDLLRFVIFNPKPAKLAEGNRKAVLPTDIVVPPSPEEVPVLENDEEHSGLEVYVEEVLVEQERPEEPPVEEPKPAVEEEPKKSDEEIAKEALTSLLNDVLGDKQMEAGKPEEETSMADLEPINIEITEDQTVEMEINGVRTILYEGKKRPAPAKPAAKPAPKPVAKPAPKKPSPKPVVKPEPVKQEERRPLPRLVNPRNTERLDPTRELAAWGPGTSDDGQRSIHTIAFEDKMKAAPKDIKSKYKELSDYMQEVYGLSHRVSFGYDSFRVGKKVVVALSLGGVHLRVNTCLDPKFYDGTKIRVNDDSASKQYKDLPSCIKIISEKNFKHAFRLIDDTMKSIGVKKIKK